MEMHSFENQHASENKQERSIFETEQEIETIFSALGEERDPDVLRETIKGIYHDIQELFHKQGVEEENISDIWRRYGNHGALIRREDPAKVLRSVIDNTPIPLTPRENRANAAIDNDEGLHDAMVEGLQGKGINALYGFHPDGLSVTSVKPSEMELRDAKRFDVVRSVKGEVNPENIDYVLFRIPFDSYSGPLTSHEQEMVDEDKPPKYITRGFDIASIHHQKDKKKLH